MKTNEDKTGSPETEKISARERKIIDAYNRIDSSLKTAVNKLLNIPDKELDDISEAAFKSNNMIRYTTKITMYIPVNGVVYVNTYYYT